jgi:hypothetical protein
VIDRLNEENSQLRQTASVFGQLAERLNHELRLERSLYSDGSSIAPESISCRSCQP